MLLKVALSGPVRLKHSLCNQVLPSMTLEPNTVGSPDATSASPEVWPKWRVRLARLSPYTIDIEEQLVQLRKLTIVLTIVPGFMATLILVLFTIFGRPDIGLVVILIIFGPIIGIAWRDYLRIKEEARAFLTAQAKS